MDRRRAIGVALVLVSAAAFGSGSLFAQPVYAAGVDWLTLSAWRFLFGAGLTWCFLLLVGRPARQPARGSIAGRSPRRSGWASCTSAIPGTYYASLETVLALAGRARRLPLPGDRRRALAPVRPSPAAGAGRGSPWASRCRRRPRRRRHRPDDEPARVSGLLLAFASCFIYAVWVILAARLSGERREAVAADAGAAAGSATRRRPP